MERLSLDAGLFFQKINMLFCRVYNGLHDRYSNLPDLFNLSEINLKLGLFSLSCIFTLAGGACFGSKKGHFFFCTLASLFVATSPIMFGATFSWFKTSHHQMIATTL